MYIFMNVYLNTLGLHKWCVSCLWQVISRVDHNSNVICIYCIGAAINIFFHLTPFSCHTFCHVKVIAILVAHPGYVSYIILFSINQKNSYRKVKIRFSCHIVKCSPNVTVQNFGISVWNVYRLKVIFENTKVESSTNPTLQRKQKTMLYYISIM